MINNYIFIITLLSSILGFSQVTLTNKGIEVQSTPNLSGVILPKAETITPTAAEEGLIFFKNSGVAHVNDGFTGIIGDNPQGVTLGSNTETSRLFKRLELPGTINSNHSAYLTFNCGSSNTDKNPLVKDQNLGFRPWSLAVKFKPGAKEGANPILSQTNGEARRGIYLQLEQNQLVLHFGDYTNSNLCTDNTNTQCNSYVAWRSNISFTPHMWQKVLITFSPENSQWITKNDINIFTANNNEIEDITNKGQFVQIGNGYNKTTAGELFVGLSKVDSGNGAVNNYFKGDINYIMLIPFKVGGNLLNANLLNDPVVWASAHKNQVGVIKNVDQIDYPNSSKLWLMGNGSYDSTSKIVNSLDYSLQTEHLELIPNTNALLIK